jgi:hypothetical protein
LSEPSSGAGRNSYREVDTAIPLFYNMFKDARHSLTVNAVYSVSVAGLGVNNKIITISGDLGVEAGLLGQTGKLGKDAFKEWHSGIINDFNALWEIETPLQH